MPKANTYVLKGYGNIDAAWLRDCLSLFRAQSVNIRKLLLLKSGPLDYFSMLEIHFALPEQEALANATAPAFLPLLHQSMEQQPWERKSLAPLE